MTFGNIIDSTQNKATSSNALDRNELFPINGTLSTPRHDKKDEHSSNVSESVFRIGPKKINYMFLSHQLHHIHPLDPNFFY